jgi:hypothetical protein
MTTIRAIMDPDSGLKGSVTYPLVPNPQDDEPIKEADFMLPENRPQDQSNFTTPTEDEFECDRCDSAFYRLITRNGISYARCTECGWVSPNVLVDAIASIGGAA